MRSLQYFSSLVSSWFCHAAATVLNVAWGRYRIAVEPGKAGWLGAGGVGPMNHIDNHLILAIYTGLPLKSIIYSNLCFDSGAVICNLRLNRVL